MTRGRKPLLAGARKQEAIVSLYLAYPDEGCNMMTLMMLDADVVGVGSKEKGQGTRSWGRRVA